MIVVEHLEKHIGTISRGADIVDKKYNITISIYDGIPFEDSRTYSTLGMSRYFVDYYYVSVWQSMMEMK